MDNVAHSLAEDGPMDARVVAIRSSIDDLFGVPAIVLDKQYSYFYDQVTTNMYYLSAYIDWLPEPGDTVRLTLDDTSMSLRLEPAPSPHTDADYPHLYLVRPDTECNHQYVDVGFMHERLACKFCGKDYPYVSE